MDNRETGSGISLREILGDREYARLMKSQERVRRDQAAMEARREMCAADEAREASLRGYPYGADSEYRRRVDTLIGVGKFVLVALPVGALVLWTIWTVIHG